jgi:tripartite-type tricarboxylate transporter receptor subunit TctC
MFSNKGATIATVLTAILAAAPHPVRAEFPDQPVKIVVPFAAGGFIDGVARIYADRIAASLGKAVIIENRTGAGGKLGEDAVAAAAPDGYTLMLGSVIRPTLVQAVTPGVADTDILKAFVVVGELATTPVTLNVSLNLGVKDFRSAIAKIKAEPGVHSYGSPGIGTASQLVSAQLVRHFDLNITHVPYRGGAAALTDLAGGSIDWMADTPTSSKALADAGKIITVAVTGPTRLKQTPQVPTLVELGLEQFRNQVTGVFVLAPAGTPTPILQRLNTAIADAQKDPATVSRLDTLGLIAPSDISLTAAHAAVAREIEAWSKVVK